MFLLLIIYFFLTQIPLFLLRICLHYQTFRHLMSNNFALHALCLTLPLLLIIIPLLRYHHILLTTDLLCLRNSPIIIYPQRHPFLLTLLLIHHLILLHFIINLMFSPLHALNLFLMHLRVTLCILIFILMQLYVHHLLLLSMLPLILLAALPPLLLFQKPFLLLLIFLFKLRSMTFSLGTKAFRHLFVLMV